MWTDTNNKNKSSDLRHKSQPGSEVCSINTVPVAPIFLAPPVSLSLLYVLLSLICKRCGGRREKTLLLFPIPSTFCCCWHASVQISSFCAVLIVTSHFIEHRGGREVCTKTHGATLRLHYFGLNTSLPLAHHGVQQVLLLLVNLCLQPTPTVCQQGAFIAETPPGSCSGTGSSGMQRIPPRPIWQSGWPGTRPSFHLSVVPLASLPCSHCCATENSANHLRGWRVGVWGCRGGPSTALLINEACSTFQRRTKLKGMVCWELGTVRLYFFLLGTLEPIAATWKSQW